MSEKRQFHAKYEPKKAYVINDNDIIKVKRTYETIYKDGCEIKKPKYEYINVTQKVNETAKLLKIRTIKEKIEEIEKATKGDKKKWQEI